MSAEHHALVPRPTSQLHTPGRLGKESETSACSTRLLEVLSPLYFLAQAKHFVAHMRRFAFNLFAACLLTAMPLCKAETNNPPDFQEIYKLLRTHLAGATAEELNRAVVEGLLKSLRGKATLVWGDNTAAQTNAALVSKVMSLENEVAYLRVRRVAVGLANEIGEAIRRLSETNKLKGVTLDLRFAEGDDYAAAAAVADMFIADAKPLLDWGDGPIKSTKKFDIINIPVAVLANRETSGAAEALAAVLRETGVGLILGSTTAGNAMICQEFVLKTGQRLRIGIAPVKLGNGTPLSAQGVKPDIEVVVTANEERAYMRDAYARPARTNLLAGTSVAAASLLEKTNRLTRRPRTTEADLVRARRNGTILDEDSQFVRDAEPERPIIRDPTLARAVDLLKGLAVVRRSRP